MSSAIRVGLRLSPCWPVPAIVAAADSAPRNFTAHQQSPSDDGLGNQCHEQRPQAHQHPGTCGLPERHSATDAAEAAPEGWIHR